MDESVSLTVSTGVRHGHSGDFNPAGQALFDLNVGRQGEFGRGSSPFEGNEDRNRILRLSHDLIVEVGEAIRSETNAEVAVHSRSNQTLICGASDEICMKL